MHSRPVITSCNPGNRLATPKCPAVGMSWYTHYPRWYILVARPMRIVSVQLAVLLHVVRKFLRLLLHFSSHLLHPLASLLLSRLFIVLTLTLRLVSCRGCLKNASATMFNWPFLYDISKSYCCSSNASAPSRFLAASAALLPLPSQDPFQYPDSSRGDPSIVASL